MTPEQQELKALGFEIPDSITPIVACRSWRVDHHTGFLCSHNATRWIPGKVMKAKCQFAYDGERALHEAMIKKYALGDVNPDEIPFLQCTCGIYAAKHEDAHRIVPRSPVWIHGEVYLWGKIVEGHMGYRAQYAYPKRFFPISEKQKLQLEAMEFGVPVVMAEEKMVPHFPFPPENQTIPQKVKTQAQTLSFFPLLVPLPSLGVAVWDSVVMDLSKGFNLALVAIAYSFGVAAMALGIFATHLRRSHRKMMRRLYS